MKQIILAPLLFLALVWSNCAASESSLSESSLQISPEALVKSLEEHLPYKLTGPNLVGHIYLGPHDTGISESSWIYVRSALKYYKEKRPTFIILELNTPGGEVFAAGKIAQALKAMDFQEKIPIVAVINNWAVSAGALLAYFCRYIAVAEDAIMGAAEPVMMGGGQVETASEKINSVLRAEFSTAASTYGRNPLLAEAMVDKDIILVLREGKIVKLDKEEAIRTEEPNPDEVIIPAGKLLTLEHKKLLRLGIAEILLPTTKPVGSADKPSPLFYTPYFQDIPEVHLDSYTMDWRVRFFAFLANPIVQSILFLGLMIGLYMELSNPGVIFPGAVAAVCLFFIILSSYNEEAIGWLEVIMILVGAVLLGLEVFVIPGFGFLGIAGIFLIIAGLFALMLPSVQDFEFIWNPDTYSFAGRYFLEKLAYLGTALILGICIIVFLARYFMPKMLMHSSLISVGEQDTDKGYVAGIPVSELPPIGSLCTTLTRMRPSGKILYQDRIFDAMSDGGFLEKDIEVIVARLEGNKIFVNEKET